MSRWFGKNQTPVEEAEPAPTRRHPFLEASARGRDRLQAARADLVAWRLATVFLGVIVVVLLILVGVLVRRPHAVPYYIQIDRTGGVAYAGAGAASSWEDDHIREALIRAWIKQIRTIYPSPGALQATIEAAYAQVLRGSQAEAYLNAHFGQDENDPGQLFRTQTRSVEVIEVVVPQRENGDYRVQWVEQILSKGGELVKRERWEAYLSTRMRPPQNQRERETNLAGFWIQALNWSPMATLD